MKRTDRQTEISARAISLGSASSHVSLEGVHSSVEVPHHQAGFWKQWRAFVGPAILVSVGYMDPGNWGTDLQGGARFKYGLLWVVGLASLMAIFMQMISARLGVVTGKDLAQCCRDWYPRWTRWPNWLMSEVAIGACDLAEVLGSAVALNLLFRIPLLWAVIITGLDVLLLLALQRFGMRTIEAVVLMLIATIGVCYFIEIFILPQTQPSFLEMGRALVSPHFRQSGVLYLAIGIIGATVMPHNLYLHSALVQSRKLQKDEPSIRSAIRFNSIDSIVALTIAFFVNAAILVLAAMVFFGKESVTASGGQLVKFSADSDWIRVAYLTLAPLLGTVVAAHHPHASHPACCLHYRHTRGEQRYRSADPQSSSASAAASIRHVPTPAFHEFPQANGEMEERLVPPDCGLEQCYSDHRAGHIRHTRFAQGRVAGDHRQMTLERKRRQKWNSHVRHHSGDVGRQTD
jgi:NRAMP (natural resistance-associated macrophage protein)-like metal ion transporter